MLTHSTVESVEARQPTWLAIFETLLSIAIYAFIAWRYQTYVHFVVAAVFAPLFLLRTNESTEWLQASHKKTAEKAVRFAESLIDRGPHRGAIILFIASFMSSAWIVVKMMLMRPISTFYWLISRPINSLKAIPGNWFQQTSCVDIFFLPEMIPGENIRSKKNPNEDFQLLGLLWNEISSEFRKNEGVDKFTFFPMAFCFSIPIIFAYGLSFFYRIGFKSTSIFYFPLVWVSSAGLNDDRPIYERLERFRGGELEKTRRTLSLIIAPIVALKIAVMLSFADLRAAVEKLAESSWFVFLRPLLEQLLDPGFMAWWVVAITVEVVLTFVLFFYADEAIARKDGAKPWPERRVKAIASALITLRSGVAVLLVCSVVAFAVSVYVKTM